VHRELAELRKVEFQGTTEFLADIAAREKEVEEHYATFVKAKTEAEAWISGHADKCETVDMVHAALESISDKDNELYIECSVVLKKIRRSLTSFKSQVEEATKMNEQGEDPTKLL